jgi:hypothetical protein
MSAGWGGSGPYCTDLVRDLLQARPHLCEVLPIEARHHALERYILGQAFDPQLGG